MKVSNKVSLPGQREFEQHTAYFELDESDVSEKVWEGCTLLDKMLLMNTLVVYQGLLYQYAIGFITKETKQKETKAIFGVLSKELRSKVKEALSGLK